MSTVLLVSGSGEAMVGVMTLGVELKHKLESRVAYHCVLCGMQSSLRESLLVDV